MRLVLIATAILTLATSAAAQRIEVADGDWSDFPTLEKSQTVNLGDGAMNTIDRLVADGKCSKIGSKKRIRMDIPFLVQFVDGAKVERVMLKRIGCPEVESVAANAAYYAAKAGRIRPGTSNAAGWYRGTVSYILD